MVMCDGHGTLVCDRDALDLSHKPFNAECNTIDI